MTLPKAMMAIRGARSFDGLLPILVSYVLLFRLRETVR